jgi:hypothetical protein
MSKPEHFEILKERAVFRPTGQVSIGQAAELVATAIGFARSINIRRLLVDITELTGFEPPDLALRYLIIHEWARAAGKSVSVALVVRPEMIDQQKFGSTVAANIGFVADAFTTEEDALTWLWRVK